MRRKINKYVILTPSKKYSYVPEIPDYYYLTSALYLSSAKKKIEDLKRLCGYTNLKLIAVDSECKYIKEYENI